MNGDENAGTFGQEQNDSVDGFNADDYTGDQALSSPDQNGLNENSPPGDTREPEQTKPTSRTKANTSGKSRVQDASAQNGTERSQPAQKRKGRGRPPKSAPSADDEGDQRPSKKARISDHKPANANAPLDPELEKVVGNYAKRTGPLKGRSLYVLKREAPTDNNATHTRSGRAVIRPLAYWRNERCVYGDGEIAEGQRYPTATIKEIIRTEEREPEKKRTGKRSSKKSKSRRNAEEESEDEGEDHVDPWEKDGGVLHGYIRKWDSETQAGMDEEEVLGKCSLLPFVPAAGTDFSAL